ncbi:MAG: hypothetical protein U1F43_28015 [Myxococcota bacterium]
MTHHDSVAAVRRASETTDPATSGDAARTGTSAGAPDLWTAARDAARIIQAGLGARVRR